jgi:hypothetical protein
MRQITTAVAVALLTLAFPYGSSTIRAEQDNGPQTIAQGQQGQAQQGQGQQGQGQQGQGQQGQRPQGQGQQGTRPQGQGQQGTRPQAAGISLRKFVITLALGDVQAGAGSNFTPPAAKALGDLKGFLPYKTYTLLDTVFKIGLTGPTVQVKGVGVGQMYELVTHGGGGSTQTRTAVRVQLKVPSALSEASLVLIDTQFEIEIGETVVVGTSRLDGNRALLLLVTSVP